MIIAADRNIPHIREVMDEFGTVVLCDSTNARGLMEALAQADMYLCRSTVQVGAKLLDASPVRFVATATSGTDHVDMEYFRKRGIAFASAPGSNARSVAEYVFTALFELESLGKCTISRSSIGIIGVGHVGGIVASMARRLGMRVILNDPPLAERSGDPAFRSLEEALSADIVTLHVPLTVSGEHPTRHLLDRAKFSLMKAGAVLVNTARGTVVDLHALQRAVSADRLNAVVLDVFPDEPQIDTSVFDWCDIVTPHIAGHSYPGKLRGTQMVHEAVCSFLGISPTWDYRTVLPPRESIRFESGTSIVDLLRKVHDIREDDRALRSIAEMDDVSRAGAFQALRNEYRKRYEFDQYRILLEGDDPRRELLGDLGFVISLGLESFD